MSIITRTLFFILFFLPFFGTYAYWPTYYQKPTFTIMINPAGDAQHTGRNIGDSFERSITLQCAEKLKTILEQTYPGISVILTRFASEVVPELQNANFANRLNIDLFISLHFYAEQGIKPNLFVYHFSYNNNTQKKPSDFTFYHYDHAYIFNGEKSQTWAKLFHQTLAQKPYTKLFNVHNIMSFPFKPLIGITSPALAIEASIKESSDWNMYVEPLMSALDAIISSQNNNLYIS